MSCREAMIAIRKYLVTASSVGGEVYVHVI